MEYDSSHPPHTGLKITQASVLFSLQTKLRNTKTQHDQEQQTPKTRPAMQENNKLTVSPYIPHLSSPASPPAVSSSSSFLSHFLTLAKI